MPNRNDQTWLVRAVADGDRAAFGELYNEHRHHVFGFALRMLGDSQIAEDVTHEAFLALIEHPERYRPERGSLLTYLCAITRNQILLHWRRQRFSDDEQVDGHGAEEERVFDAAAGSPLKEVLDHELEKTIAAAIAALPPSQREVIVLREYHELSYEEIAAVVGSGVDVVRMRLRRARQSLARYLGAYIRPKEDQPYELQRSTTEP